MLWRFLAVGAGGFVGSCLRFAVTKALSRFAPLFPFGVLVSNIAAALAIGFIIGLERASVNIAPNVKLLLTTGLLGGLSTFSTFSMETIDLFQDGKILKALANVGLNVGLSLVCVLLGLFMAKKAANI